MKTFYLELAYSFTGLFHYNHWQGAGQHKDMSLDMYLIAYIDQQVVEKVRVNLAWLYKTSKPTQSDMFLQECHDNQSSLSSPLTVNQTLENMSL